MHSLKVAGGVILFLFGVQMLFGKMDKAERSPEEGRDLAVFPLAVPAIAGPGAMMAAIVLTDNDVYTVPERIETGMSFGGPGACNGTHPLLSRSGNRADSAGGRKLGTGCAALADRGQKSEVRGAESREQRAKSKNAAVIGYNGPESVRRSCTGLGRLRRASRRRKGDGSRRR